jgi:hypothetical protein
MNPFEMVVLIVAIVMVTSVLRVKYSHRRDDGADPEERSENRRLRDEVQQLQERIKVLERITVDKENSLARQIEELRDR